jgi:hypothetical protein
VSFRGILHLLHLPMLLLLLLQPVKLGHQHAISSSSRIIITALP